MANKGKENTNEKRPVTAAQMKATAKYNKKNYDRIELRVPKGKKQIINDIADKHNISINAFINRAIDKEIERSE